MEETLQCVAAGEASDLACHLKMGVGNGTGTFHFCYFVLVLLLLLFAEGEFQWQLTGVSRRVWFHQHLVMVWELKCLHLYTSLLYVVDAPTIPVILPFQHHPLSLSAPSKAFVLHSIIPLLQSGVEKRESGNFRIIASHFCNLYAMRTLRACSYNQVCRNHVRCFTNSWGDGSSSGDYGFPCC